MTDTKNTQETIDNYAPILAVFIYKACVRLAFLTTLLEKDESSCIPDINDELIQLQKELNLAVKQLTE